MFNCNFFEAGNDIIPILNQADGDTDVDGDWVKLSHYERCLFLIAKYGTEDVDTLGFQIVQSTVAAGSDAKAVSAKFQYWYKQGTLTSQGVWTAGQLSTADDILGIGSAAPSGGTLVTATDTNTSAALLAIDVPRDYLDIANGFRFVTLRVEGDESNNAVLVSAWAILSGGRFKGNVPPNSIA